MSCTWCKQCSASFCDCGACDNLSCETCHGGPARPAVPPKPRNMSNYGTITEATNEKLVRDNMPKICATTPGKTPMTWRHADPSEMSKFLQDKLAEEALELIGAISTCDKDQILQELADVIEVAKAISRHVGASSRDVEIVRMNKLAERGGFSKGIIWDGKK